MSEKNLAGRDDSRSRDAEPAEIGAEDDTEGRRAGLSDEEASSELSQCLAEPEPHGTSKDHSSFVEHHRKQRRGDQFGTIIQKTQTLCTVKSGEFAPFIADGAVCTDGGVFGRIVEVFGSSTTPFYACWFEADVAVGEAVFGIPESFQEAELE